MGNMLQEVLVREIRAKVIKGAKRLGKIHNLPYEQVQFRLSLDENGLLKYDLYSSYECLERNIGFKQVIGLSADGIDIMGFQSLAEPYIYKAFTILEGELSIDKGDLNALLICHEGTWLFYIFNKTAPVQPLTVEDIFNSEHVNA